MALASSHHTVQRFDAEIEKLIQQISEMGQIAERQVQNAVNALIKSDAELVRSVIAGDERLSAYQ